MRLSTLSADRVPELLRFNEEVFPTRVSAEARFEFQVLRNPLLESPDRPDVLIVTTDDGEMIGQVTLSPVEYRWQGSVARGYVGADLFVKEAHRSAPAGGAIALKIARGYSPFFSVGVSEVAEKVFTAVGIRTIGSLRKFLWLRGLRGLRGLARAGMVNVTDAPIPYPSRLTVDGATFERVETSALERLREDVWAGATLQFDRAPDFLRWRFFSVPGTYTLYALEGDPRCFFAVRSARRRGLRVLALVDYRIATGALGQLALILRATKALAAVAKVDGVATMSSLEAFHREIRRAWFFPVGHPLPILSNLTPSVTSVLVTMADSDTDLRFDRAGAVFG